MSKFFIYLLLALLGLAQARFLEQVLFEEWHEFKLEHRKNYQDQTEELFRLKIFRENKLKIAQHNQRFAKGEETFKMAVNEYADLMSQEFNELMNGFNYTLHQEMRASDESLRGATFLPPEHLNLPQAVDWRSTGAVTEVKDQGQCGSCWAFSSTGSLEGQHFRKTGKLVSLSEQNLVDCTISYGNGGCSGGYIDLAFQYIKENDGIDTEISYPYRAADGTCRFQRSTVGATSTGFVDVPRFSEVALAQAVASVGPVSVAIDASHESFHFYESGIYQEKECDPQNLDHAVLVVGFGTENGQDFWLVKNSWGTTWGDEGYIKMLRNGNNQCGIASLASYPLV